MFLPLQPFCFPCSELKFILNSKVNLCVTRPVLQKQLILLGRPGSYLGGIVTVGVVILSNARFYLILCPLSPKIFTFRLSKSIIVGSGSLITASVTMCSLWLTPQSSSLSCVLFFQLLRAVLLFCSTEDKCIFVDKIRKKKGRQ